MIAWCASRVYCLDCEHQCIAVYPAMADEGALQCGECGGMRSLVVTRILPQSLRRLFDKPMRKS